MPNGQGLTQDDLYLLQLELARATPEEAERILDRLIGEGRITQEQLNGLVDWYVENVGVDEEEEISPVVRRERQIAIDEAIMRVLRDPDVPMADKATIRGSEGQKLVKAYLEKGDRNFLTVVKNMLARAESLRTEVRGQREEALSQTWESFSKNPITAPYLKDISETEIEAYLSGQSNELMSTLSRIREEAYETRRVQTREAKEAQRAEAFFAGLEELGKPAPEEERQRPPMPSGEKVVKSFLKETGLAKGTKLRSFLAGEFIPEVFEATKVAREAWWRRMHPRREEEEDFAARTAHLQEEARRWAGLAWGPRAAPEAEVSGGVYYGPGGLRGVAERAYRHALETLGGMEEGDEEEVPEIRPDPLIAALRKEKFRPAYYRGAGTGLVRALTPAVRY